MDGDTNEICELNHGLDADIVHRTFDFRNMRLRNARLFLNIALAQTGAFPGSAEVSREILALQLTLDYPTAFLLAQL